MDGTAVRLARERLGLTQQQAARRWKMSQAYVSLVEQDKRPVPERLARALARAEPGMATGLSVDTRPLSPHLLPQLLGALQYPGFAYLGEPRDVANPAAVVLAALRAPSLSARVSEAMPWVLAKFAHLGWDWLVDQAKLANAQNRLGFLVGLAREFARGHGAEAAAARLAEVERRLDDARLVKEETLGRDLTDAERRHLREHRSPLAAHWNLLTGLRVDNLRYEL